MRPRRNVTDSLLTLISYCTLYVLGKYDVDYIDAHHIAVTSAYLMLCGKCPRDDVMYFCDAGGRLIERTHKNEEKNNYE